MTPQIKQRIEQIRRGEVPEGYKKTVAGIIPSEWELHLLSDHLQESRIPGSNGSMAKKLTVKLWNKGVVEKRETHEGSESTTYYSRKSGQLIYSKLDFLNCAFGIIPDHLDGYESTQDLPCFDIDGVNPYYLLTYMTQRSFYSHYGMIADGGRKARRVNPEDMLSFPLIYPSILEQEKIAKVLETQDRVITLYEKKVEQLKKLKRVFLQKMFPKHGASVPEWRFPEFTDAWEQRKLSDIYQNIGNAFVGTATPYYVDDGHFYLESNNVKDGQINHDIEVFINDEFYENQRDKWLHAGDMVMVQSGHVGHAAVIPEELDCSAAHALIMFRTPKVKIEPYFLNYQYQTTEAKKKIDNITTGNTIKHILASDMQEFIVDVTSYNEQTKIAEFFLQLDNLITLHQRKCDEEKQKKKALMQLLLSGIVRV